MLKKKLIIFMPSIEGGGVEKNLFIISNYLGKKIPESKLITCDRSYNNRFKNLKVINPKVNVEKFSLRRLKYLFCFFELIKIILKNKDILVFAFQANLYCAIVCKIFGVKVIIRSNSSPSGWNIGFFRQIIFKNLLSIPNKIIVNSKEFQIEYKKRFNIKTSCIYNPLDKKKIIKLSSQKVKNSFFKDFNNLKIIFIGRLVDQKDPMTFVKAMKIIKKKIEYKALIIGEGKYDKHLQKFIKKEKLKKNIKIINWQNNPYKYLKLSDLLILTSKFEGLPNVLLEAICLKKFIISSNCPTGPKEILLNGKGGLLFKVGNYKELSKKIIFYVNNKKKLKKKINYSHKNISRFDYRSNLNLYFNEIYKEIKY